MLNCFLRPCALQKNPVLQFDIAIDRAVLVLYAIQQLKHAYVQLVSKYI